MTTIKTVKGVNNKEYRVRKLNGLNDYYYIDTFETRLNASKVEIQGYYYVTCADSQTELKTKLDILTK